MANDQETKTKPLSDKRRVEIRPGVFKIDGRECDTNALYRIKPSYVLVKNRKTFPSIKVLKGSDLDLQAQFWKFDLVEGSSGETAPEVDVSGVVVPKVEELEGLDLEQLKLIYHKVMGEPAPRGSRKGIIIKLITAELQAPEDAPKE